MIFYSMKERVGNKYITINLLWVISISIHNSRIIFEPNTQTPENGHIISFALFDLECHTKEIFQYA